MHLKSFLTPKPSLKPIVSVLQKLLQRPRCNAGSSGEDHIPSFGWDAQKVSIAATRLTGASSS